VGFAHHKRWIEQAKAFEEEVIPLQMLFLFLPFGFAQDVTRGGGRKFGTVLAAVGMPVAPPPGQIRT
jgi:hypothetical protein